MRRVLRSSSVSLVRRLVDAHAQQSSSFLFFFFFPLSFPWTLSCQHGSARLSFTGMLHRVVHSLAGEAAGAWPQSLPAENSDTRSAIPLPIVATPHVFGCVQPAPSTAKRRCQKCRDLEVVPSSEADEGTFRAPTYRGSKPHCSAYIVVWRCFLVDDNPHADSRRCRHRLLGHSVIRQFRCLATSFRGRTEN